MTDGMHGALPFDRSRAFYVGLNKVADARVSGRHSIPDHTYNATAKVKAAGAVSPVGAAAGIAVTGFVESGVKSNPVSDPTDRSQLLAIAPEVFADVTAHSFAAERDVAFDPGRDYYYSGAARYDLRTHDDFRQEGQQDSAPRLGLWLIEIPDTLPEAAAQSVTWIVLSATAEGQLKTELGGRISDWRGGSQTEHLFELLTAKMAGLERSDPDERWLQDPYYALAARNLLRDSREQHVEVAFMCLDTHDCPTSGEAALVSFQGWGPASTDREVAVSRVILGTPYFVQLAPNAVQDLHPADRSLRQRFKEYFGL
ncbi:hypothetical protein E3T26_02755 [Cryobacterium sp. TMT1-21]|uniref:hypothetical protein n=1 Tax=Cryobacterium sp. TMT1-21 TaxID=1259234 RepID=UPI00106C4444|nr:hypothetical protein [Cryobacterium sp. TMT1-21]TFD17028.1 hypothetical protein E3T26_02755 [Cryobacterium sp. TMT1-21]